MKRGQKYPVELLERRDVAALLAACGRSRTGLRNRALLALLAGCGLRVSEALSLEPRDYLPERGELRVRSMLKGGPARTLPLPADVEGCVEAWLKKRPDGSGPLLCTLAGGAVQAAYVRGLLRRLAARGGVERRTHPHGLRHFRACEWDRDGVPLAQISTLLGHRSVVATAVYLQGLRGVDPMTAERLRGSRSW